MGLRSRLEAVRLKEQQLRQDRQTLLDQANKQKESGVPRVAFELLPVTVVDQEAALTQGAKRPYAIYTFQVTVTIHGSKCIGVFGDRYSNLLNAHKQLQTLLRGKAQLPGFPSKHWPRNMTLPRNTTLRSTELLSYFCSLFRFAAVLQSSSFLLGTLQLPEEVAEAAVALGAFLKEKRKRKQRLAAVKAELKEVKKERAHLEELVLSQTFHRTSGAILSYSYQTEFSMSENLWDYGSGVIKGRGDNVFFKMDRLNPSLFNIFGDRKFAIVNRKNEPLVLVNEDTGFFKKKFIIEQVVYDAKGKRKKRDLTKVPICAISRTSFLWTEYLVEYFGPGGQVDENAITISPGYHENSFEMLHEGKLACQMERQWFFDGWNIHMHAGADVLLYLALCICVDKMRQRVHGRPNNHHGGG
ncbi:hypothetical protein QOT17_014574 [Balamuthia mandrillaris]